MAERIPLRRVTEIIEGKESGPLAHRSREMPVWKPIFHEVESDMDLDEGGVGRYHQDHRGNAAKLGGRDVEAGNISRGITHRARGAFGIL
jgi:hypothetical protein